MQSTTLRQPGLRVTEHTLSVPLDHARPEGDRIEVFARAVVAADKVDAAQPWLLFLQGGPGFEGPRPTSPDSPAWLRRALADHRVLLLDQRGMGRSSPLGPADAAAWPPPALADRLALYRADSIVRDAECFRTALGIDRWSVLGQSFGGFCAHGCNGDTRNSNSSSKIEWQFNLLTSGARRLTARSIWFLINRSIVSGVSPVTTLVTFGPVMNM